MRIGIYAIFDRKTLAYQLPYFAPTDGAAVRTLADAMAGQDNMLSRHPNDFVLYAIGEYDDAKAVVIPVDPLRHVIDAISLVRMVQSEIPFPESVTTTTPSKDDYVVDGHEKAWFKKHEGGNF